WAKAAAESKDRAARVKSALPNDEDEFTVSSLVKLFYVEPAGREKLRANGRMQPETLHATSLRLFTRVDFEDHVDLGAIIELADRFGIALLAVKLSVDLVVDGTGVSGKAV